MDYEVTNRRVDLINERFDVALRVRLPPLESSEFVMKILGESAQLLAGSPALLDKLGRPQSPTDLRRFESLSFNLGAAEHLWHLTGPDGTTQVIDHKPRLTTDDMTTLRQAALAGAGIVQLPDYFLAQDIADGKLEVLLPAWSPPRAVIHAVFPSRRGLLPAAVVAGVTDSPSASETASCTVIERHSPESGIGVPSSARPASTPVAAAASSTRRTSVFR